MSNRDGVCASCLFWSDLIAEKIGNGPLMALCESPGGPKEGRMVTGGDGCPAWQLNPDVTPKAPRP